MPKQTSLARELFRYAHRLIPSRVFFAVWRSLRLVPVVFYTRARGRRPTRGVEQKRFGRAAVVAVLGLAVVASLGVSLLRPLQTTAAVSDNINFQARLENTAGAISGDGNYNVEFKLYNAATGGSALWTEDYLNSASQGVRVVNGYLTVNLGSITAFPGTIAWDQSLYITMNIGGTTTGSPSWDGEMSPRLKLTAVPYAFQAKSASQLQVSSGANVGTLSFATPTATRNILLPNDSGTVCLDSNNCNYASASGSASYIQNRTTLQTNANFNIQSTAVGSITGTIQALGSQTADLLRFENSGATAALSGFNNSGQLYYQSGSFTGTIVQDTLTSASTTYHLPDGSGSQTLCTFEAGNCAGSGSGITGTGTTNYVARFNTGTTINASTLLFDNNSFIGVGTTTNSGTLSVTSTAVGQVGLFLKAAASATAPSLLLRASVSQGSNLAEFQNASNNPVAAVTTTGDILNAGTSVVGSVTSLTGIGGQLSVLAGGGTNIGAVIRAGASQTGNLLQFQDNGGAAISGFNSAGDLYMVSGSLTGTIVQDALTHSINVNYHLPDYNIADQTLCTFEAGNCAGSGSGITGTGTTNYVARFNTGTTINASTLLFDNNTFIGVNSTTNNGLLNVQGNSAAKPAFFAQGASSATTPVAVIRGGATPGTGGDLLQLQLNNGTTVVASFDAAGNFVTAGSATIGSLGAGLVQSSSGGLLSSGSVDRNSSTFFSNALNVSNGGTGLTSTTAYGLLTGGTTSTGNLQSVGTGSAGQILQSAGTSALPSWVGATAANTCSDCLIQNPLTTARNTIAPTTNSIVGLTVKGTTGTSANVLDIYNSAATPTLQAFFDSSGALNVSQAIQPTGNNSIDLGLSGTAFRSGYFGTSVLTPLLDTPSGTTTLNVGTTNATNGINLNQNTSITGTKTLTVGGLGSFNGGLTVINGQQLTNAGSTLLSALAISDLPTGGAIGTAAATVNGATTFNINQTTAGQNLSIPNPTSATAGRLVYINNVGTVSFTIGGVTLAPAASATYIWNGSSWVALTTGSSTPGVTTIGTIDTPSKSADGAHISGNILYMQSADASFPGLVTTGAQTLAGNKTFSGVTTFSGNVSITGSNTLTIGTGTVTLGSLGAGLVQSSSGGLLSSGAVDRNSSTFFSNALNVTNGGTGAGTFTTNGVVFGNGTGALQVTSAGTGGQLLLANASGVPTFTTLSGDTTITSTGSLTVNKLQGNTLTISSPATGQYLRYNGAAFVNSALNASDLSGTLFTLAASSGTSQNVSQGQTVSILAGSSNNLTTTASNTNNVTVDIISNPTFSGKITGSSGTTGLALTGTPVAGSGATSLLQLGNAINGGNSTSSTGGTYVGINEPGSGAGSTADFLNFQNNNANRLLVTSAGALTEAGALTVQSGGATITGNSTITGTLSGLTGLTSSGTITFSGLSTVGIVHNSAAGVLSTGAVALGTETSGNYVDHIGTVTGLTLGGTNNVASAVPTLSVNYGSAANTAVQGNTTLTCASGTGNLTGGGNSITLGTGGTCNGITIVNNPTFSGLVTANGGLTVTTGSTFTNASSTLLSSVAIANHVTGGDIGTAATTVDVATTFDITQTTAGQTLTLPNPTAATSGRIVYINSLSGNANFTLYGVVMAANSSAAFIWNGSAWIPTSTGGTGVNTIGTIDTLSPSANGAVISGSSLYLQSASGTVPGLVNLGPQTFSGAKTFSGTVTVQGAGSFTAAGTGLSVTNNATIGGTLTVNGTGKNAINLPDTTTTTGLTIGGDTNLYRSGAGALQTDGTFSFGSTAGTLGYTSAVTGSTLNPANDIFSLYSASSTKTLKLWSAGVSNLTLISPTSASGNATILTVTSGANNTPGINISSGGTSGTSLATGAISLQSGSASGGTNSSSGNITIDSGAKSGTGTTGTISIGTANSNSITIGNTSGATATTIQAGTGGISLSGNTSITGTNTLTVGSGATSLGGTLGVTDLTTLSGGLTVTNGGNVAFQKGSDYSTTGTTNDVNLGTGALFRLTGSSAQTITGITGGADGRIITIVNAAAQAATLSNQNAGSTTAADRIITGTGADLVLAPDTSVKLVYDNTTSRWRVVGSVGGTTINTIGTIDTGSKSNDGAHISGNSLILQSADGSFPGLVTINAQTFAGAKTFSGDASFTGAGTGLSVTNSATVGNGLTVSAGGATITGNSTITGTLSGLTGLTSSGTITFSGLSTVGIVHNSAAGVLSTGAVALGTETSGNYVDHIGTVTGLTLGGTNNVASAVPTLSVNYGSAANTAVQGNTTLTCASGTGNLTGGGNSITLGTGGTCNGITIVNNPTFSGLVTANGGLTVTTGSTFTNASSTLLSSVAIANHVTGGDIGTAATTVDVATTFDITQTTAGQTLTLPNPTAATSGRIVYINSLSGNANFTLYGVVMAANSSAAFIWNGSAWIPTSTGGTGVNTIGTIDTLSPSANGAVISGSSLYLQSASGTVPGLVNLGPQTFSGAKTFSGTVTVQGAGSFTAAGTGLSVTNNATIGGTLTVNGTGKNAINLPDTTTTTGLTIGGDTNLYRSGAGALQTDGTFSFGSTAGTLGYTSAVTGSTLNPANDIFSLYSASSTKTLKLWSAGVSNLTLISPTSASGNATILTVTSGANNTPGINISSGGTSGTSLATGAISLQSGSASGGTNSSSGNITIDSGAKSGTGTTGTISIGTANSNSITIGNTSGATATTIQAGTGGISLSGNTSITGTNTLTVGSGATSLGGTLGVTDLTTLSGGLTVTNGGNVAFQKGSDYSTTGTTNDVNLGTGALFRLTGSSAQTITGITGGADGRIITIVNAAAQAATLSNQNAGSTTAADRIITGTGADLVLAPDTSVKLVYDNTTSRWRVVGSVGGTTINTIGTIDTGSKSNDGAHISGNSLILQSADGSFPGLVTINAQTFAGAKTFSGDASFTGAGTGLSVTNSATVGNGLTVSAGGATITGNSTITGTLSGLTGLTSSGTITFSGLSTVGIVHNSAAGVLSTGAVALGTETSGNYVDHIGTVTGLTLGGTNNVASAVPTLSVNYGSAANTAVQGNTTLTCASGTGNLTGGGNSITLGTGGTCNGITIVNNPTFSGLVTANGGLTVTTGSTFTNASSSLLTAKLVTDPTSGDFSSAASSVDVATTFNISESLSSQALTIPVPTLNTAGRVIYVNSIGSQSFTIGSVTLAPGASATFIWNGSAWVALTTGSSTSGVSTIGTFDTAPNTNADGAHISGNTLYLQSASATVPGLVNFGSQTFGGVKTFNGDVSLAGAGTGLSVTNAATIGNGLTVTAGGATITAGDLALTGGNLTTAGVQRLTNAGALQNITGYTQSSGNFDASSSGGSFKTSTGAVSLSGNTTVIGSNTFTVNSGATSLGGTLGVTGLTTLNGGLTVKGGAGTDNGDGTTFTNNNATLNTAKNLGNLSSGSIGTAANTVDVATTLNIAQTTAAQAFTLPNPTSTTAGRLIYINNTGTADFTITSTNNGTITVPAKQGRTFQWSGAGGAWNILDNTLAGTGLTQSGNTINSAASTSVANDTNIQGSIASNVLTLSWAGTLSVARGGTGAGSFTSNGIVYGNGTGALQVTAAGTQGQLLFADSGGTPAFTTVSGDITSSSSTTGQLTISKLQGNTLTITSPGTGQYLRYNGSAFVNSAISASDISSLFTLHASSGSDQTVNGGSTVNLLAGTNITTAASATNTVTVATVNNPTFTGTITASNSSGVALAVTGTPTASATAAQLLLGASASFTGNSAANGGTYLGINEPSSGAGSTADFLNFQVAGTSKFKVDNTGAATAAGQLTVQAGGISVTGGLNLNSGNVTNGGTYNSQTISSAASFTGTLAVTTLDTSGSQLLCYDGTNKQLATCTSAPGGGNYINNNTSQQTNANFNIQSAAAGSVGGVIAGAASQTADLLELQNSSGTVLAKFDSSGILGGKNGSGSNNAGSALTIAGGQGTGTASGGNINLQIATPGTSGSSLNSLTTVASLSGTNGAALFQNAVDSTTGFQVQRAGAGGNLFTVNTSGSQISIGSAAPATSLLTIGTNSTTTAPGGITFGTDTSLYRSGSNQLATGGALFLGGGATAGGTVTAYNNVSTQVKIGSDGTNAAIQFGQNSDAEIYRAGVGQLALKPSAGNNSTTTFQVQNASSTNIFNVDTTNGIVGTAPTTVGSTNSQNFILQTGNATGATSNSGSLTIDTGTATGTAGNISIGTGAYAHNLLLGSTTGGSTLTLQSGSGGIAVNTSATLAANQNLTLSSGTGTITQTYVNNVAGTAATFNVTNSNATGTATTVNALGIGLTGTASGTNTINAINLANVTPIAGNTFNALNVGTGYTNILQSANATISAAGAANFGNTVTVGSIPAGGSNLLCSNGGVISTCSGAGGGGVYLAKNTNDTSSASFAGNLYGFTNTNTGSAGVLGLTNNGTNSALSVLQSGTSEPVAGQALILANNNTTTPTGNLLDLQNKGTSKFSVDVSGNVTAAGTINLSNLTASRAVFTDSSKNLVSSAASSVLFNSLTDPTGTGVAVFGTSPTVTTSLLGGSSSFDLLNNGGVTGTINFGTNASTLSVGATASTTTINGNLTVAANKNLTLNSGTGQLNQTYVTGAGGSAASAQSLSLTNNNTGAGIALQGRTITPTNTTAPASGVNTINGVNFAAGTIGGSNVTNGINFASATGYTNFINSPTAILTSGGAFTGLTGVNSSGTINFGGLTASRAVFTDSSKNLVSSAASSVLFNSLTDPTGTGVAVFGTSPTITTSLVAGGTNFDLLNTTATTINFGGAATVLSVGAAGGTTTINGNLTVATNKNFNLGAGAGTGTFTQSYSNSAAGSAQSIIVANTSSGAGVAIQGLNLTPTNTTTPSSGTNQLNVINFAAGTALSAGDNTNGINFASATGYTNFINTPTAILTSGGAFTGLTGVSSSGTINFGGLTASRAVFTDSSKNLVSSAASSVLFNSLTDPTGTGAVVFGTSPTVTTSLLGGSASFDLLNNGGVSGTINFGGSASVISVGATASTTTINGNLTVANNKNLSLGSTSGSGQFIQSYSSNGSTTSSAQSISLTNSNAGAGVAIQGINLTPTNTTTPSSGTNQLNIINFAVGNALSANDTTNGINFASATGYTNFISTPSAILTSGGAFTGLTGISSSGTINFSGLTASRAIFTDSSKNLVSSAPSAALLSSLTDPTGSGVAVFGTSPTVTTSLLGGSSSFDLLNNAGVTSTINFGTNASTFNIGSSSSLATFNGKARVASAPAASAGSSSLQVGSALASGIQSSANGTYLGINTASASTADFLNFQNNSVTTFRIDSAGTVHVGAGNDGVTTNCSGGQVLSGAIYTGGITTGGTCSSPAGFVTLQNAYDNSGSSNPQITLNHTLANGGFKIADDAGTPVTGNLFQVTSAGASPSSIYLGVSSSGITTSGTLVVNGSGVSSVTGSFRVGSSSQFQIDGSGNAQTTGSLKVGTAGSQQFQIDSSGNVTIATSGSTNQQVKLNNDGTTANNYILSTGNATASTYTIQNLASGVSGTNTLNGVALSLTGTATGGASNITNAINFTAIPSVPAGNTFNGLNFGANYTNLITSANFKVTGAGAVTAVGVNSGTGLLQGTGGLTVTGTTSINTTGAGTTTIGGASAGAIALQSNSTLNLTGGADSTFAYGTHTLAITSNNFGLTGAGDISTSGGYTQSGTTANSFSGPTTVSNTLNVNSGTAGNQLKVSGTFSAAAGVSYVQLSSAVLSGGANSSASGTYLGVNEPAAGAGSAADFLNFQNNGAPQLRVTSAGNVVANGTVSAGVLSASTTVTAGTGYQIGGAATTGHYLRGNAGGTAYVDSALQATDATGVFLKNVPSATSDNTVQPTANGVVSLTLQATSGTGSPDILDIRNSGGGTLLANFSSTGALVFTGTNSVSTTSGTLTLQGGANSVTIGGTNPSILTSGANALTLDTGTAAAINLGAASPVANAINLNQSTTVAANKNLTFTSGTGTITQNYSGTATALTVSGTAAATSLATFTTNNTGSNGVAINLQSGSSSQNALTVTTNNGGTPITALYVRADGNVGIGTAAPTSQLTVTQTSTATTGTIINTLSTLTAAPTAASTGNYYGGESQSIYTGTASTSGIQIGHYGVAQQNAGSGVNVATLYGLYGQALVQNAGTASVMIGTLGYSSASAAATGNVTNAIGLQAAVANLSTGGTNFSNAYGLQVATPVASATGTIGTDYGVYIAPQAAAGIGTAYGLYQAGASDLNQFQGVVGLGVTPTVGSGLLQLATGTDAAHGILFGGDTNLYRSAASTLKTNAAFQAVGKGLFGGIANVAISGVNPQLQVVSVQSIDASGGRLFSAHYDNNVNAVGPAAYFSRSRGTTLGATTAVQSGDQLGALIFQAADGTTMTQAAKIQGESDGAATSGSTPGRIVLYTTPSGSNASVQRLTVDNAGNVAINGIAPANGLLTVGTNTTAATGGLYFGTDTNLYRSAASTLKTDGGLIVGTIASATTANYLCANANNQISSCNTTGTGAAFVQGGNNFGANAVLGTTGAGQTLAFETAGTSRAILDATGNLTFQQASTISTSTGNLTVDTPAANTLALGATSNTIVIGASAGTGNITLGSSSVGQSILIANGAGAPTVSLANVSVNGVNLNIAGAANTSANSINIANGASAANSTVNILSGVGTAGAGDIHIGNNTRVNVIDVGNIAPAAARTTTIAGGAAGVVDTVNIGIGAATVAGGKTIHIGDGTPTGSGTNLITIGSIAALANTTTIQGGNGSGAVSIQSATSGTIGIGTAGVANTVTIGNTSGAVSQTLNFGTNATSGGTNLIHIGDAATALNTIAIGSTSNTSNGVNIEAGTAANGIQLGNGATAHGIQIGTGAAAQTLTVGSTNTTSTTTVQAGTGNIILKPNGGTNTGVLVKPVNDSTAAFQIQNAAGTSNLLFADTTNTRIGIGTNAPTTQLDVEQTTTSTSGVTGSTLALTANPSSALLAADSYIGSLSTGTTTSTNLNAFGTLYGAVGEAFNNAASGTVAGGLIGAAGFAIPANASNTTTAIGVQGGVISSGSGTITSAIALMAQSATLFAGTATNAYGLYVNTQKTTGVTNAYGVYQLSANDINIFNGKTSIGSTVTPSRTLDVTGTIGGSEYDETDTDSGNTTHNIANQPALVYNLSSATPGLNGASFTSTYNVQATSLPTTNGTLVFFTVNCSNNNLALGGTHTCVFQINGTTVSTITATNGNTWTRSFTMVLVNGTWRVVGSGLAGNPTTGSSTVNVADYAEYIHYSDANAPASGTLLTLGDSGVSAKASTTAYDAHLLGVVSTSPFQIGGQDDGHSVIMGLTGRVPVNVSLENGAIQPGDPLTSSSTPGAVMKATGRGRIIGTAIEAYDGTQQTAQVMVQLHPGYNDPTPAGTIQGGQTVTGDLTIAGNALVNGNLSVAGAAAVGSLTVTGSTTLADLTVSGPTTLSSLTVTGSSTTVNLTVSGTATIANLTVTGSAQIGGDLAFSGAGQTRNAITKHFKASVTIHAGEVVVADPAHDGQVATTTTQADTKVLGIAVSDAANPGDDVTVAIGGSVQVKTPATTIHAGDLLVSSNQVGQVDINATPTPGSVVGKALGQATGGLIWVLVTLQ